ENSLLLARSVTKDGKSRALLAGAPTTANALTSFGDELIEIHGQHGAISLLKESRQRELLDQFIGTPIVEFLNLYRDKLSEYRNAQRKLQNLERSKNAREAEIAELESLSADAKKLAPSSGELAEIDREIELLSRVEQIRLSLNEALAALSDEESGATIRLSLAKRALNGISEVDKKLGQLNEVMESAYFQVSDVASEISAFLEALTADPARLENLQVRKSALRSFAKRFGEGASLDEQLESAIERSQGAHERLQDISGGAERIRELEEEVARRKDETLNLAKDLSSLRAKESERLAKQVTEEIRQLSMSAAEFKVNVMSNEGEAQVFTEWGIDRVEMLFLSHKGGAFLPISKSASGGELSRVMLALEVVVASKFPLGTYLFDEVDAGIGGKAALEVGKRLKKLAENAQVIVVTHLPQVAIWADRHLLVVKDSNGAITQSSISVLSGNDLESEIARMLSGLEESEHAQEHARELLNLGKA
ncbi:MAG: DNA repair protein RecN, partial [Actinomycetales bacterium]